MLGTNLAPIWVGYSFVRLPSYSDLPVFLLWCGGGVEVDHGDDRAITCYYCSYLIIRNRHVIRKMLPIYLFHGQ